MMKLRYVLMIMLTVLFNVPFAKDERTVRLQLPEELNKNILPQFSARDGDGENLFQRRHLQRLVEPQTKRVALVFFATWCVPCAKGAMVIRDSKETLKENGVQVIFVNTGERDAEAVNKWIRQYGGPALALIMDSRMQMAGAFGLLEANGTVITPKTLVLDRTLKPLFLLGAEGSDFPEVLWGE